MSSSKSPEALDTLEADLRSRLDEEVRTLEAYRGRLEREARVDAELARIDAVIARRVASIPPPAPASYHPASYHPASYRPASYAPPASYSAAPPAMPSWNAPSSVLPPAPVAPAPTSQPIPFAYQTSRMVTLATVSAMLAVIVSLTVLVITAGDRIVPSANAAERPATSAPVSVAANAANAGSCSDKAEPAMKADDANAKKTDDASAKSEPVAAPVVKVIAPVAPVAKNVVNRRSAAKSAPASKSDAPAAADVVAAAPAAAPAPAPASAPAPAATNMDDASRTAQMLREQLSASLK